MVCVEGTNKAQQISTKFNKVGAILRTIGNKEDKEGKAQLRMSVILLEIKIIVETNQEERDRKLRLNTAWEGQVDSKA